MTRKFVLGKYLESVYLSNPFTLVPTDFQLYMKMKHKFYFRFSLLQNNEIGLPFPFCIFSPPGIGKETELRSAFFIFVTWKNGF